MKKEKLELDYLIHYLGSDIEVLIAAYDLDDLDDMTEIESYLIGEFSYFKASIDSVDVNEIDGMLKLVIPDEVDIECYVSEVKPLLRSVKTMTKEEMKHFGLLIMNEAEMSSKKLGIGSFTSVDSVNPVLFYQDQKDEGDSVMITFVKEGLCCRTRPIPFKAYRWLFDNHFDIFGLIEKGLAVDKLKLKKDEQEKEDN